MALVVLAIVSLSRLYLLKTEMKVYFSKNIFVLDWQEAHNASYLINLVYHPGLSLGEMLSR